MEAVIIEDSESAAALLRGYLKKFGYGPIRIGYSAKEGLKILGDMMDNPLLESFLVFVDWMMPQMNGLEFIEQAKPLVNKRAGFIMVTSKRDKESVQTAIRAGFHGYVVKPYSEKALENMINTVREGLSL